MPAGVVVRCAWVDGSIDDGWMNVMDECHECIGGETKPPKNKSCRIIQHLVWMSGYAVCRLRSRL